MSYTLIILIILIMLIIFLIMKNCKSESFNYDTFYEKLNERISTVKYPNDRIIPLNPINITDRDCELCVFSDNYKFYNYGDYIKKQKNKPCPPNSIYMNSCVYINPKICKST